MPPHDSNPRSPKHKGSSSGLLNAFRSLTGQKRANLLTSNLATSVTASEPTPTDVVDRHGQNSTASLDEAKKESDALANEVQQTSNGPDIADDIFAIEQQVGAFASNLASDRDLKERLYAAKLTTQFLSRHHVTHVGRLWRVASDLLDEPAHTWNFQVALNLYKACLKQQQLTALDQRELFNALPTQLLKSPQECIYCFSVLTKHGLDFDNLEMARVANLLAKLVKTTSEAAAEARRRIKKDNSGSTAVEDANLEQSLKLVADAFRLGPTMFDSAQFDTILAQVFLAARKTSLLSELSAALQVLNAFVSHCIIPEPTLRPLLEVLCSIYCSVDSLAMPSRNVIWKILKSYHSPTALLVLEAILRDGPKVKGTMVNSIRGAVKILHSVLLNEDKSLAVELGLGDLIKAMSQSLKWLDVKLEQDVLDVVQDLVNRQEVFAVMLSDSVWPNVLKLITRLASSEAMQRCKATDPPSLSLHRAGDGLANDLSPGLTFIEAFQHLMRDMLQNESLDMGTTTPLSEPNATDPVDDRKQLVLPLFLRVATCLDEKTLSRVLKLCRDEKLHTPPHDQWLDACEHIHKNIFQDPLRTPMLRAFAFELLAEAYSIAAAFDLHQSEQLIVDLAADVSKIDNPVVLRPLLDLIIDVAPWVENPDLFEALSNHLQDALLSRKMVGNGTTEVVLPRPASSKTVLDSMSVSSGSLALSIAQGLVKMFLRTVHKSYYKARHLYNILLSIAQSSEPPADARISALKLLVRLRADINYGIFVVPDTESEDLAVALCRTADSAVIAHLGVESPLSLPVRVEDNVGRRKEPGGNSLSRSNSSAGRSTSQPSKLNRATPPLWMYPGPKGIPEEPYYYASQVTYACFDEEVTNGGYNLNLRGTLNIGIWVEVVVQILNSPNVDWEIFSYVIVHLPSQLTNHALFRNTIPQIKLLRRTICEKLSQRNYVEPPAFTHLKKSDAAVCLFEILTMLISYVGHFNKDEEQDAIVKAFVFGVGSWERTSETCINGLTICCHEMPSILARYLDTTLHRMSQIITQSNVAASILEFLATLARLPELFRNFRDEEFKTVFGICFRYLQFVRDSRDKQQHHIHGRASRLAMTGLRATRDVASPVDSRVHRNNLGEALPQYVHTLTYHVMTFWFMALRLQDRPKHIAWITKNLTFRDENGTEVMEEQAEVAIDMMFRVAYSDHDETSPDPHFAKVADGTISARHFLLGTSILSIETAGRSGISQIVTRRASGTNYATYKPLLARPHGHQANLNIGLAADAFHSADYIGVTPEHIMQTLFSPLFTNPALVDANSLPIVLPDDDATKRAITTFDRISALDGHKAGIIYVGEGQKDQVTILSNVMGSADYMDFLNGIGTLTELKGAQMNTQGLDTEYGTDGKFTYCWRDRVTEIVFHVTTMMPTNLEHDSQCALKKRHVGNDFVNIIFNNSGSPFDFDTIPSEFNFVNIVITPEARTSFVETRLHASRLKKKNSPDQPFYKVTVLTKPGLPSISAAAETKIISAESLPAFVRLIALNASVFSIFWANRDTGEHPMSWKNRLMEIKRLRSRHIASAGTMPWAAIGSNTGNGNINVGGRNGSSGLYQSHDTGNTPPQTAQSSSSESHHTATGAVISTSSATKHASNLLRRASAATFFSDASTNKRSSGLSHVGDLDHD